MGRGINKVTLIGNVGRDPEIRFTTNQQAVATISIATTRAWKDRQSGDTVEQTDWHRVVFFQRLAEIVRDYIKKGSRIYVEGRLQTRKWQDQQGNDRYTTEVVAQEMQMLDRRSDTGGSTYNESSYAIPETTTTNPTSQPLDSGTISDDDIPF